MSKGKKLFNSEDFDKKKPLFGSEDFDKPIVVGASNDTDTKPHSKTEDKLKKRPIIGALIVVVAVAVVIGVFIFATKGNKDNNAVKPSTETVAKDVDKQETNNDTTVAEPQNKDSHIGGVSDNKSTDTGNGSEGIAEESSNSVVEQPSVSNVSVSGDVESNARRVIRGDFGNGQVRKDKLGASYSEIQSKVNEMYRNGLVR